MIKSMTEILDDLQKPYPEFVKYKKATKDGPANVPYLPWNAQRNILNKVLPGQWSLEYPVLTKVEKVIFVQCRLNIQTTDGLVYFEGWGEKEQDFFTEGKNVGQPKPMYGDCTKQAQRSAFKAACSWLGIGDWIRAGSQNFGNPKGQSQNGQSSNQQTSGQQQASGKAQPALIETAKPEKPEQPQPATVDRKTANSAAVALQAPPAIKTGLERPCPKDVSPEDWEARCALVPRILEICLDRWGRGYGLRWLADITSVQDFSTEDLYLIEHGELGRILDEAKAHAVPRDASLTDDERFRKECAEAGFAADADRLIKAHTFKGETKFDLARKALESLKTRNAGKVRAA